MWLTFGQTRAQEAIKLRRAPPASSNYSFDENGNKLYKGVVLSTSAKIEEKSVSDGKVIEFKKRKVDTVDPIKQEGHDDNSTVKMTIKPKKSIRRRLSDDDDE